MSSMSSFSESSNPDRRPDTKLWHPFANMGDVRDREFVLTRGEDVWVWDTDGRRYSTAPRAVVRQHRPRPR